MFVLVDNPNRPYVRAVNLLNPADAIIIDEDKRNGTRFRLGVQRAVITSEGEECITRYIAHFDTKQEAVHKFEAMMQAHREGEAVWDVRQW